MCHREIVRKDVIPNITLVPFVVWKLLIQTESFLLYTFLRELSH